MKNKIISIIIITTLVVIISSIFTRYRNTSEASSDEEVYDVILFWGQSNMLGCSSESKEERHIGREEEFANDTDTNINIVKNIDTSTRNLGRARVKVENEPQTAYEYIMYPNSEVGCKEGQHLKEIPQGETWEPVIIGEPLKYNTNTHQVEYVPVSKIDGYYEDVTLTGNMNMIPEFCKDYYYLTGHKVVAVLCAEGGKPIDAFAPSNDFGENIYEVMKHKFNSAVKYVDSQNMKIGGKYFVSFQGEANVRDDEYGTTEHYEKKYREVVDALKRDCGITNGALVETGFSLYLATMEQVNRVHTAQEKLIKNYSDTVLGSKYAYESFVPVDSDYNNCFTNVCYDASGKKLDYGTAYAKASERVDSHHFDGVSPYEDANKIHFTSASLCQIGAETATNFAEQITGRISSIELFSIGKTTYIQNKENFDVTGWKIQVNYNNGKSTLLNVTNNMIYNFDNTKVGSNQIMIYYHDKAVYPNITIVSDKQEEEKKRQEEEKRRQEEAEKARQEEIRKQEEEKRKQEEAEKARQEEIRKQEEEKARQEEIRKQEEEKRKQEEAEKARQEEIRKQEEEKRRQEEAEKARQEEIRKQEEEKRKQEEEKARQEEIRKQEEEKKKQEEQKNKIADLNNNGKIDIGDILILKRHIAQQNDSNIFSKHLDWRLDIRDILKGDLNKNGKIDVGDVLIMARLYAASNDENIAKIHPDWLIIK